MRVLALIAVLLLIAGCGGGSTTGARNTVATTDDALPRLSGKAAEKAGAEACRDLPPATMPEDGTKAEKIASLRAYLQSSHPNDDVQAMLKGCRAELSL
jgi:hypothetical protein